MGPNKVIFLQLLTNEAVAPLDMVFFFYDFGQHLSSCVTTDVPLVCCLSSKFFLEAKFFLQGC